MKRSQKSDDRHVLFAESIVPPLVSADMQNGLSPGIEDAALAKSRRSSEFLRELALAEAERFEKQSRR